MKTALTPLNHVIIWLEFNVSQHVLVHVKKLTEGSILSLSVVMFCVSMMCVIILSAVMPGVILLGVIMLK